MVCICTDYYSKSTAFTLQSIQRPTSTHQEQRTRQCQQPSEYQTKKPGLQKTNLSSKFTDRILHQLPTHRHHMVADRNFILFSKPFQSPF